MITIHQLLRWLGLGVIAIVMSMMACSPQTQVKHNHLDKMILQDSTASMLYPILDFMDWEQENIVFQVDFVDSGHAYGKLIHIDQSNAVRTVLWRSNYYDDYGDFIEYRNED